MKTAHENHKIKTTSQFSSFVNLNLKLKDDLVFRNLLSFIFFEIVGWSKFLKTAHLLLIARGELTFVVLSYQN